MPTYSHSQLSTYETCPHQYKLSYIDKIKVETEGIEAFMGSRVHDALEKLYRDLKVTKLNTLEEILDYYRQDWEKNWNEEMIQIIRKDYTAEDYRSLGEKCITEYYKRYYPFDQGKTLGLEENIYFPLDEEKGYWIRVSSIAWPFQIIPSLKFMTTKRPAGFPPRKMWIPIVNLPFITWE